MEEKSKNLKSANDEEAFFNEMDQKSARKSCCTCKTMVILFVILLVVVIILALVVRSKIKEHAEGMNVSGDFANALSAKAVELIKAAARRAKENGRKTLKPHDL